MNMQLRLVWPAVLSFAGAPTAFGLAWYYLFLPFSAPAGDGTGLGGLVLSAFFGLSGILALTFAIIQLVDPTHTRLWGRVILTGYSFAGLVVTGLIILPFVSSPAIEDLPLLFAGITGPLLGATGGVWGSVWNRSQTSPSTAPSESRLTGLFQRKWLIVLLLILLALETSILILIAVEWSFHNQSFPPITLMAPVETGCASLTASVASQSSANRTVLYDCGGSPAKRPRPALKISIFTAGGQVPSIPIFALPPGYQKLWLIDGASGNCTSATPIPIKSGEIVGLGAYWQPSTYDYCATIGPSGPVKGFTIRWTLG